MLAAEVMAKPVARQLITSEWSPKIDSDCAASARAETWKTVGIISPAILYMFGIIRSKPWLAVKVVVNAPAFKEPCTAPAAPASDCISATSTFSPNMFFKPWLAQVSAYSPMVEEGVIG